MISYFACFWIVMAAFVCGFVLCGILGGNRDE